MQVALQEHEHAGDAYDMQTNQSGHLYHTNISCLVVQIGMHSVAPSTVAWLATVPYIPVPR